MYRKRKQFIPWLRGETEWDASKIAFQISNHDQFTDTNQYCTDISADYQTTQPRRGHYVLGNGTDISIDTKINFAQITEANPFRLWFKWKDQGAGEYVFSARDGSYLNRLWMLETGGTQQLRMYNTGSSAIITTDTLTDDTFYIFEITRSGANTTYSVYSTDETLIDSVTIATPNEASNDIQLMATVSTDGTTISGAYEVSIGKLIANGETFNFDEETGSHCIGTSGSIMTINGTLTTFRQIDDSFDNPNNSTGWFEVPSGVVHRDMSATYTLATGTIVPYDPDNPTKALCKNIGAIPVTQANCTQTGKAGICPQITVAGLIFPPCPETYAIELASGIDIYDAAGKTLLWAAVRTDWDDAHFVYAENAGEDFVRMIGFTTVRSISSSPTQKEVEDYLGL